jgi:chemotaxis protein methyltransferase CheR
VRHATAPRDVLGDGDAERLRAQVRRLTGIEMPQGRRLDLERAAKAGIAATGAASPGALMQLLDSPSLSQPALVAMLPALTVGETHFFRNRPQMEALARDVLPQILERRRKERRLRIWSAGCASGEEAYSLAMLIDGLLPDRPSWDVRIAGTDLNPEALERARLGVYGSWSFREVPETIVRSHFTPVDGGRLELSPEIRAMVRFAPLNLVTADYGTHPFALQGLDLILCRNVLIYFRREVVRDVIGRLERALAPGGWLVTGHVEPSQDVFGALETVHKPGTILYRRRDPVAQGTGLAAPVVLVPGRRPPRAPAATDRQPAYAEGRRLAAAQRFEAAQPHADRAVDCSPLWAPAHLLQGMILAERGLNDLALAALRRCLFLDPRLAAGHLALADALQRSGQGGRAARALAEAGRLAAGQPPSGEVPAGEGLTWGRLSELVAATHRSTPASRTPTRSVKDAI